MSVSVKAFLSGPAPQEIRRFQLPVDVSTNYDYLRSKIADVFPILCEGNFKLYWRDSDGDEIRFSCDDELVMALSSCTDDTFRLYIKVVGGSDGSGKGPSDGQNFNDTPHPNVTCDVCNNGIHGIRYKCCMCPDFDLCAACEQTGVHSEHVMLRIVKPMSGGGFGHLGPWFARFMGGSGRRHPYCQRGRGRQSGKCGGNPCGSSQTGPQPSGSESAQPEGNPGEEYLKNIGETLTDMLGSFGVDLHYDIEHNGPSTCPRGRCPEDNPAPSTSTKSEGTDTTTNEPTTEQKATPEQTNEADDQSASSSHADSQSTSGSHADSQSTSGPGAGAQSTSNNGAQFGNQQEVMESMTRAFNLLASMGFNVNGQK